jgi:hypothetical protein
LPGEVALSGEVALPGEVALSPGEVALCREKWLFAGRSGSLL